MIFNQKNIIRKRTKWLCESLIFYIVAILSIYNTKFSDFELRLNVCM